MDGSQYFFHRKRTDNQPIEPFSTNDQLYQDATSATCIQSSDSTSTVNCPQAIAYKRNVDEYNNLVKSHQTAGGAYSDELAFYNRNIIHNFHLAFGIALMLGTINYMSK